MPSVSEKPVVQFQAKEIRDILKSKAHCLRAGFSPHDVIIQTLNEIRNQYIRQVGLPTYLSQMLGNLATAPMQHCTLYGENDRPIELYLNGNHTQPVQRFIAQRFTIDGLPFKVEVRDPENPARVDSRYL